MIRFSPLNGDAIEHLIHLESQATPNPWTLQNLADSYASSADCYQVEWQGESIGYCIIQNLMDEAELLNIVVFKSFQSRGYGAELVEKIKGKLLASGVKKLFLEVRASNLVAQALYEKMGFEVVNIRRNYYRVDNQGAEDALVMQCVLT